MPMKRKTVRASVVKATKKRAPDPDDEEEEEVQVKKRPALAVLKKPAAAREEEEEDEEEGEDEEEEDEEEAKEVSPAQEARDAVKVVGQNQRLVRKLSDMNERLAEKIKANKALMRKAEKELEASKDTAKKKTRKLGAIQGAKMRKQMLAKKNRFKGQSERAAAAVLNATKRYNKMRRAMGKARGKNSDVETIFKRAQSSYEDAKKLCTKLKKEGEDVPDEGEKDLSAKYAWKPPGVKAAKARDDAKAAFLKAKTVWERVSAPNKNKEERVALLKAKMDEAKAKQEEVEAAVKEMKKKAKK